MKKFVLVLLISAGLSGIALNGQKKPEYSKIDIMLVHGEYGKVIDTCRQVIAADSMNSEVYFKMGLAYQNILPDDKSFDCFLHASAISPENNMYRYMVAKGYFNKGKNNQAKPLLLALCAADSMNWSYAYYLTSIYLQEGQNEECLKIYDRFYKSDSTNYVYLDKIGFANLKMGNFTPAIEMFNRSLAVNKNNINAIKNLAYLYSSTHMVDTAVYLLSRGIDTDPADMDLYARRAALNFARNYNKRALNDYLKILESGDSSFIYLKRAGIGYSNNMQPKEGNIYLLLATGKDSTDLETLDCLARNYDKLRDLKKSIDYYKRITDILGPMSMKLGMVYVFIGEEYRSDGQFTEAINYYLKGQKYSPDPNINMIIANIYDEKLNNIPEAIRYYQLFIDGFKNYRMAFTPKYIESIKKRLEFLKEKQNPEKI